MFCEKAFPIKLFLKCSSFVLFPPISMGREVQQHFLLYEMVVSNLQVLLFQPYQPTQRHTRRPVLTIAIYFCLLSLFKDENDRLQKNVSPCLDFAKIIATICPIERDDAISQLNDRTLDDVSQWMDGTINSLRRVGNLIFTEEDYV